MPAHDEPRSNSAGGQLSSSAANFSLSSTLTGSAARRIALACKKSSARKAPTLGRTTRSGAPCLIFSAVMALPMTSTVASRHSQGLGMSRRSSVGAPEISTATTRSARPRSSSNGSGLVAPPSIRTRSATTTGRITVGSAIEVGRDDGQGNFERAEIVRHLAGQELLAEFFRVDQRGAAEAQVEEIGKRARARRDQAAKNLGAVMGERDDEAADLPARHPRRVGGCDQGADRGAGDGGGLLAHVVERFQHRDVGEPARAAAAEREGKSLRHRAPASRANSQALTASGRTSGAMAAAFSLVAVPSRTRPTMPWKIAARRKKL